MYFDWSDFAAQISVSCALVSRLPRKFGIGLVLRQITSLRIQKPASCSVAPSRKTLWYDPITQIAPSGFSTRRASPSQARENSS